MMPVSHPASMVCERPAAVADSAAGMPRARFLAGLIGAAWAPGATGPDAWDCWHLAVHIQATLFGRLLPAVDVPAAPSWAWMISTIADHAERAHWREIVTAMPDSVGGVGDGALVLMARCDRPAHIGVWLRPEFGVIHADARVGVTFQSIMTIRTAGWRSLRFFEPVT